MNKLLICILFIVFGRVSYAQLLYELDQTIIDVTPVRKNLVVPWEIVWGPDDYIWLTHNRGTISRMNPETGTLYDLVSVPDIYNKTGSNLNDSRMMGLAIHPDFDSQPYVYTNYTYQGAAYTSKNWDKFMKVVRYEYDVVNDTLINPVDLIDSIAVYDGWHIGGKLIIGADDKLYLTIGDAKFGEFPELHPDWTSGVPKPLSLDWYSGKVIRINLDGSVPTDNPFAEAPFDQNAKNLTWSYGHRNTQGLALSQSGKLYYSEHGPSNDDESGHITKGGNYGWPTVEGYCDKPAEKSYCDDHDNIVEPLITWDTPIAPSNMEYYGHDLIPEWKNSLLIATLTGTDRAGEDIRVLHLNELGEAIESEEIIFDGKEYLRIRDLAVSRSGEIYFTTSNLVLNKGRTLGQDDIIYKISVNNSTKFAVAQNVTFEVDSVDFNFIKLNWQIAAESTHASISVERSLSGTPFQRIANNLPAETTDIVENDIILEREYAYRIITHYAGELERVSETFRVKTPGYYPPVQLSASLSNSNLSIIHWSQGSVFTPHSFEISRSENANVNFIVLDSVAGSQLTFTDGGTLKGKRYYYKLRALYAEKNSDRSESIGIQTLDIDQPKNIEISLTKDGTLLSWEVNFSDYDRVLIEKNVSEGFVEIGTAAKGKNSFIDPSTDINNPQYRLRAENTDPFVQGEYSETVSITPLSIEKLVNEIKLYPNPAAADLHVNHVQIFDALLINASGKTVRKSTGAKSYYWTIADLPEGLYFLVAKQDVIKILIKR